MPGEARNPKHIHKPENHPLNFNDGSGEIDFIAGSCSVCGRWIIITESKDRHQHMREADQFQSTLLNVLWGVKLRRDAGKELVVYW